MRIAVYSAQDFDRETFCRANKDKEHEFLFHNELLEESTTSLAESCEGVCIFVNDDANARIIGMLALKGVKLIALRCTGYNNVDLEAAGKYGITVVHVPEYSPYAIAEYTVGLLLAIVRKINRAWMRVRLDNFSLNGLVGQDLHGKTVGIVGTGRIGALVARTMKLGFDCNVVAMDVKKNPDVEAIDIPYVELEELIRTSDIVCLHCPMNSKTRHLVNMETIKWFKKGATLINTSRGGLTDAKTLIYAIEEGILGALALDVYEDEKDLFFRDFSSYVVKDANFQRLTAFPNVLCTGHQAFFTTEALDSIAKTTLISIKKFEEEEDLPTKLEYKG